METTQWMQNIINSKPVGSTHIEFGGKMLYWCFSGVNSGRCFRNGSWCSGKVTEHLSSLEDMQNQIDLINLVEELKCSKVGGVATFGNGGSPVSYSISDEPPETEDESGYEQLEWEEIGSVERQSLK